MKILISILILILPLISKAQSVCENYYSYSGEPGNIKEYSIPCQPYDVYRVDFCTQYIPDKLIIYTNKSKTDSLLFYIGGQLDSSLYQGYCLFLFDEELITIKKNVPNTEVPIDFVCEPNSYSWDVEGMMRLIFVVPYPLCELKIRLEGNKTFNTVYDLCVTKIFSEGYEDYTIIDTCDYSADTIVEYECIKTHLTYIDHGIKETPLVTQPYCNQYNGSIEFLNYSMFNQYNLKEGIYNILVENDYCSKNYKIELKNSYLCEYYIPNVIRFNSDLNDIFTLYTNGSFPYHLEVFDRWGNNLVNEDFYTNINGWNGFFNGQKCLPGVYTYFIKCEDQILKGDLTILR